MTITIFHWPPAKSPNFHDFEGKGSQISNFISITSKRHFWRGRRIMTYWGWGCAQRCDLWAWLSIRKKRNKLSCVKLAIFCPDHPRRHSPLKFFFHAESCSGNSYICHVLWKSVQWFRSCVGWGSKIALSHWLSPRLIQQLVYRTSRDAWRWCCSADATNDSDTTTASQDMPYRW